MQQSTKEVRINHEGPINLRELFNIFLEKKFLIAGLTSFLTAVVLIILFNLPVKNQSISSFTLPSNQSIASINKLNLPSEIINSFFSRFLNQIVSKDFQRKVFIEGDFLTKLNNNNSNYDNNDFISQTINSIRLTGPVLIDNQKHYSLIIEKNDEAFSEYLNTLISAVNSKVISDLIALNKLNNSNKLEELSIERDSLLYLAKQERLAEIKRIKEIDLQRIREINDKINNLEIKKAQQVPKNIKRIKENNINKIRDINVKILSLRNSAKEARLNQIIVLNESLVLAKSLGIIENNFNHKNVSITNFPDWYLYGEKALTQKIKLLKNRTSDDPFIPKLVDLKNQIKVIQDYEIIEILMAEEELAGVNDQILNLKRQVKLIEDNPTITTLEMRQDDSPYIEDFFILDMERRKILLTDDSINNFNVVRLIKTSKTSNKSIMTTNKWLIFILTSISSFIIVCIMTLLMSLLKLDEPPLPK